MPDQVFVEKVLPALIAAVVAGAISAASAIWVLRKTQAFQAEQTEKSQAFQREQAEATFRFQGEQADRARIFQQQQAEKAVVVERHAQAYTRWRQLLFFKKKERPEGWAAFMNEMEEWAQANKLYLSEAASKAFKAAVDNRLLMDTIGDGPEVAHHRAEAFKSLEAAGAAILAGSPRYG